MCAESAAKHQQLRAKPVCSIASLSAESAEPQPATEVVGSLWPWLDTPPAELGLQTLAEAEAEADAQRELEWEEWAAEQEATAADAVLEGFTGDEGVLQDLASLPSDSLCW